jgi:hypothetical protein
MEVGEWSAGPDSKKDPISHRYYRAIHAPLMTSGDKVVRIERHQVLMAARRRPPNPGRSEGGCTTGSEVAVHYWQTPSKRFDCWYATISNREKCRSSSHRLDWSLQGGGAQQPARHG